MSDKADYYDDADWIAHVGQYDTPEKILRLMIDNEHLLSGDSYYSDIRRAMFDQARKVLT